MCSQCYTQHLNNLMYMREIYGYLMFKQTPEKPLGIEMQ